VRRIPDEPGAAVGTVTLTPLGGVALRVPWSLALGPPPAPLIRDAELSTNAFVASDTAPAVLAVEVGRVLRLAGADAVQPASRLEVELWTGDGRRRIGVLARLRDVLPGRYAFGLTGRGPAGGFLRKGRWMIRLVAFPTAGGRPSVKALRFTIE
jgi:hypothetical protein